MWLTFNKLHGVICHVPQPLLWEPQILHRTQLQARYFKFSVSLRVFILAVESIAEICTVFLENKLLIWQRDKFVSHFIYFPFLIKSIVTTRLENCYLTTAFLHIPVPLIKPSIVQVSLKQRVRWELCCVTPGNAKVTRYSPTPVAVWRHRVMLRRNRIPMLLLRDVIASARKSCLPEGYLATLYCVTNNGLTCHSMFITLPCCAHPLSMFEPVEGF
jgi:hypothetical protein